MFEEETDSEVSQLDNAEVHHDHYTCENIDMVVEKLAEECVEEDMAILHEAEVHQDVVIDNVVSVQSDVQLVHSDHVGGVDISYIVGSPSQAPDVDYRPLRRTHTNSFLPVCKTFEEVKPLELGLA